MIRHDLILQDVLTTNKWAWFLGLVWADGSLDKRSVHLELKASDFDNMWEAFQLLGFKTYSSRIRRERFFMKNLGTSKLYNILSLYDFKNKSQKPPTLIWNKFDSEQKNMFLRGLFEGDGSFARYNKNRLRITMNSSKDYDWSWLLEYFDSHGIPKPCIERKSRIQKGKVRNYCIITWCKTEAIYKIYKMLYASNLEYSLSRKQSILSEYCKNIDPISLKISPN
jgi:hypothetical protein